MRIVTWILIVVSSIIAYLLISNIEPKNRQIIIKEKPILDIEMERLNAITYLNELREATGLLKFSYSDILNKSAENHAKYLIFNNISSHYESEGEAGYTGDSIVDRAKYSGYRASYVSENLSKGNRNYKESVDGLFSAIYHRFGFLNFKVDTIGVGISQNMQNREKTAFVYNMGITAIDKLCNQKSFTGQGIYLQGVCSDKTFKIKEKQYKEAIAINQRLNSKTAIYPYDGQIDVPPAFFEETPDPLPNYDVSGFPISISFDEEQFKALKLQSFKLFDAKNREITNTLLYDHNSDINHMFKKYEFALFPLDRLDWDSEYRVEVKYLLNREKKEKHWHFHTRSFNEKLYTVTADNYKFKVKRGISTVFYLKPTSPHDLLGDILFPISVDIGLIDKNTIRFTAFEESPDSVELNMNEHHLLIEIEE